MPGPTTIRRRLLTLAIAVALPCGAVIGLGVYRQFSSDRNRVLLNLALVRDVNAGVIESFLSRANTKLAHMSALPAVRQSDAASIEHLFAEFLALHPDYENIAMMGTDRRIIAAVGFRGARESLLTGEAFEVAGNAPGFHIGQPFVGPAAGRWTCLLSHPVTTPDGGRIGTLVIPLNLAEMTRRLRIPNEDIDFSAGVVTHDGTVVLRTPAAGGPPGVKLEQFERLRDEFLKGEVMPMEAQGVDGVRRTFAATQIPGTPWGFYVSVPSSAIFQDARRNLWQSLGLVTLVSLLAAYLAWRHADTIARPIVALADTVRAQTGGRAGALAPVAGPAEVAQTAEAFNRLVEARREAEQSLQASELRYRTIVDQTGQMIYELDLDTGVIRWFGAAATYEITGYSLEEFPARDIASWLERVHPADRAPTLHAFEHARAGSTPFQAQYRFEHRDGSYRVIEEHGVFLDTNGGRAPRMLGRMSDVTERRRAALVLEESEERYRTVLDQTGQMIYDLDAISLTVRWFGRNAMEQVLGYTPEEFSRLGIQGWKDLLHPDDREEASARLQNSLETGAPCRSEYRLRRRDGTYRRLEESGSVLKNDAGQVYRMVGRLSDITERRQAEEMRQQMERKLQETQKLESLGVLAGGIAHDFNNLLTAILGNAGLARLLQPPGSRSIEHLLQIEKASHRAADLCRQMLAYSGRGRFVVQHIDLNSLIEDTLQLLNVSISKKATMHLALTRPLPAVQVDATQIRQVMMNLVINASEALEEKSGAITLGTGFAQVDAAYLATAHFAPELPPGNYVYFEVSDTGTGMSKETAARIFDPFFTTKFTGRGLGLAAVLGIVRGHKGAVKVYTEPGKGTTFKVLFPAAAAPADTLANPRKTDGWRGEGRVLIVDDEETVKDVAAAIVRMLGFEVETASDGLIALETFQRGSFALVLLDLTMPSLDGEETFRRLRLIDPKVKVVLMSGFNRADAVSRFTGKGLAGFVQKPFEVEALTAELRRVVQS